ncbi:hypothetical protein SteCoe_35851 [Stentor coeruleus]|uniref:Uncharacterized protein n=1 Tax=Stentor coeruleus TaxID=5963 RepID=A0A1R2ARD8_9CILI|nr:hypothetical protein SteCoe_35851 [Stentor coeruleus]
MHNQTKLDQIICRASNKNYFTPLEPKHILKNHIQRHKKFFLIYPEPIRNSLSPVSIKNYKDSCLNPIVHFPSNLPKLANERKFSLLVTRDIPFPQESAIRSSLPPIQRSSDLVYTSFDVDRYSTIEKNYKEDDQDYKIQGENLILSALANKYRFKKRIIDPVLKQNKEESFIQIAHPKKIAKPENKFVKKKKIREIYKTKFVSTGENTDETSLNGWESEG